MFKSILVSIVVAICSLLNFNLGQTDLRASMGIVALIVALHDDPDLNELKTGLIAGIFVFLMRILVSAFAGKALTFDVISSYSIEILFYASYALFYLILVRHDHSAYKTPFIMLLMLCDFGANTVEYVVRFLIFGGGIMKSQFNDIFISAFIRSAIIWIIVSYLAKYKLKNKEN